MTEYTYNPATDKYTCDQDLCWSIGFKGNKNKETVPAGRPFDVSVPRRLTWIINPHNPQYFTAARLHDYLLEIGYDRVSAAGAFNHGLKKEGVSYFLRLVMTTCVALFKFK